MLIMRDNTGVMIKRRIQDVNHVRIGVTQIGIWVDGVKRAVRKIMKPHGEFSLNDCADLLDELERAESWAKSSHVNSVDVAELARQTVEGWDYDEVVESAINGLYEFWTSPAGFDNLTDELAFRKESEGPECPGCVNQDLCDDCEYEEDANRGL